MRTYFTLTALLFVVLLSAQEDIYNENFESHPIDTELTKWKGLKFQGWNKSVWKVVEEEGNKFGQSTDQKKVFLIKSFELEAGATYRWSVDTKAVSEGKSFKRNHVLNVTNGNGDSMHKYGSVKINEPEIDSWNSNEIKFTILEGKTKVTLQIFRFAEGCIMAVDNYKLVKL